MPLKILIAIAFIFPSLKLGWESQLLITFAAFFFLITESTWINNRVSWARGAGDAILGFGIPLLPAFGSPTLLCFVCMYLLCIKKEGGERFLSYFPFIALGFSWAGLSIYKEFDLQSIIAILRGDHGPRSNLNPIAGIFHLLSYFESSPPKFLDIIESALRIAVIFGLFSFCSANDTRRRWVVEGVTFGLVVALIVSFLQIFDVIALPNQSDFWTSINRKVGTFTDPNAFGITAFLGVGFLLASNTGASGLSLVRGLLALGWMVAGMFAGSRSFFVGIGVVMLLYVWGKSRKGLVLAVGICALVIIAVNIAPSMDSYLPEGPKRVAETLRLSKIHESLLSRSIFWRIGMYAFMDHMTFGVGLNRFPEYVTYYANTHQIALPIGWTDNANNFYLGILAELGILGAFLFILALLPLRKRIGSGNWVYFTVLAFATTLFFGPHVNFDEVAVLTALLLSMAFLQASASRPLYSLAILMALSPVFIGRVGSFGFFGFETDGKRLYRWTGRVTEESRICGPIKVRALNPDLSDRPIEVKISCGDWSTETHLGEVGNIVTILPPCTAGELLRCQMEVSRVWAPCQYGNSLDCRLLGVQVIN